ncbi:MAG: hypothetical protein Kow0079_01640 [Vicingaceae bacterium]
MIGLVPLKLSAQNKSNLVVKEVVAASDSIQLDSLSIVPGSQQIKVEDGNFNEDDFYWDYINGVLKIKNKNLIGKKIIVSYRTFNFKWNKKLYHKKIPELAEQQKASKNPFLFNYIAKETNQLNLSSINKSGSISRGVSFGNAQDLSVNSNLNLQLSGKLSDDVSLLAAISDDNIPIQPDGNTQQIQDFDQVYIQLYNQNNRLTAGDFILFRPESYFLNFTKKAQGGKFETKYFLNKNKVEKEEDLKWMNTTMSVAVSKGKYARNYFVGVEGNQGPYKLKGNENEAFIIVLSGSEKVFIDGKLLTRGQNYDYVIDYNTAEITFTTNQIITKDKRITVEFQYSDKNYARSLIYAEQQFHSKKMNLHLNIYSEQDAKNQPLQQELSDKDKQFLANIGDSIQNAYVYNIDSVAFTDNIVLYKMIDSLGYDSVFVYSTNPDSAFYQLGFTNVGPNKGNYVQVQSTANGKVFKWVVPVNGIPQGDYEPVILLVTPKKRQMVTFGGDYLFSKYKKISWEGALSNHDLNTFSNKHKEDDVGYAFKINIDNGFVIKKDKQPLLYKIGLTYEQVDNRFNYIEWFRNVEFNRDFNILNTKLTQDQYLVTAYTGLEKSKNKNLIYSLNLFNVDGEYTGVKNSVNGKYLNKSFQAGGYVSMLNSSGINNTRFVRAKTEVSKQISWVKLGVREDFEQDYFYASQISDSLLGNSFQYFTWDAFIQNSDTSINKFEISYGQREDWAPFYYTFKNSTFAENMNFSMALLKNENHQFKGKVTYRKLTILVPSLTTQNPEETVLARGEYNSKWLERVISSNTYYEVGSGLEVKKEFSFAEVQPGQGTYAYIGDLNGNGVKDLNEFEVAAFQDQANYIKIFIPTTDYVKTFTTQFTQSLFIKPEIKWANKQGFKKFISRFSDRTSYNLNRKLNTRNGLYNPFLVIDNDSVLITLASGFVNSVYFNRTSTVYGLEFTFTQNDGKSLLTSGFETISKTTRIFRARWNITKQFTLKGMVGDGIKSNRSEFFNNRNFYIQSFEYEPNLAYQPTIQIRASVFYNYKEKQNSIDLGGETSVAQKIGAEIKYNLKNNGSMLANFNYIFIDFTTTANATITYEMLEGLQSGKNYTWGLAYQQNISKHMQLNLNYSGRQSGDSKIVHIGSVQVRAFF